MAAVIALASCDDTNTENMNSTESATMQISLVDDPATYEAVLIDVRGVEYKLESEDEEEEGDDDNDGRIADDDEDGEWVTVEVEPTVYDILTLQNGTKAILADIDIEAGELKEVRLILGENNQVVVDGDTLDMTVPSGSTSGLKVKIDGDIEAGADYEMIIDFEASKSIVHTGSDKYILKPVVRVYLNGVDEPEFGAISGVVAPDSVSSVVYVINDNEDSVSTMPEENGTFLVELLEAGFYDVVAVPESESGLNSASALDIEVEVDMTTEIDTLKFTD